MRRISRWYTRTFAGWGADYAVDGVPVYGDEQFWKAFFEAWLPHFDTSTLSLIKVSPEMDYDSPDGHFTSGAYYYDLGAIIVPEAEYMLRQYGNPSRAKKECKEAFFHEMIHHFHHTNNPESAMASKEVESPEFRTVSPYAATSLSEGFAELGAHVLLGDRFDPKIEALFEEEVGVSIDELIEIRDTAK